MNCRASSRVVEEAFTQSFATQFISLMLFILIFTIASFLPQIAAQQATAQKVTHTSLLPRLTSITPASEEVIFRSTLENLFFSSDGERLELQKWGAIFSLLFQHDLSLVLRLPTANGLDVAMRRAPNLLDQFIRAGVPPTAIRIELNSNSADASAEALLVKGDIQW